MYRGFLQFRKLTRADFHLRTAAVVEPKSPIASTRADRVEVERHLGVIVRAKVCGGPRQRGMDGEQSDEMVSRPVVLSRSAGGEDVLVTALIWPGVFAASPLKCRPESTVPWKR